MKFGSLYSRLMIPPVRRLSVNPAKTEYLLIGTASQRAKIAETTVNFRNLALSPVDSARNLGVTFDSNLCFSKHISTICRSSSFHIRQLRQIRPLLDSDSAIILAYSLVHSKLDYCNSLLYGLPQYTVKPLQRVQNSLARVVCNAPVRGTSASSLLKKHHWLPVPERIKYKIMLLTLKTLHFSKFSYLNELLAPYQPSRTLRSAESHLLRVPDIRSCAGRRSFSYAAPELWNAMPFVLQTAHHFPHSVACWKPSLFLISLLHIPDRLLDKRPGSCWPTFSALYALSGDVEWIFSVVAYHVGDVPDIVVRWGNGR